MYKYSLRRLLTAIPTLLAVSMVLFTILHLAPGGPLMIYAESGDLSFEQIERLEEKMGLRDPIPVQYSKWLWTLLQGDWGVSYRDGRPVLSVIWERLPATVELMLTSTFIALVFATPLGVLAATSRNPLIQYGSSVLSMLGISIPSFWLGIVVILSLSVRLRLIPSGGIATLGVPFSLGDRLIHLIAPAAVLSTPNLAAWSRYVRSSLLEVIAMDYIRTAHAKGLHRTVVLTRHALRNALIPLITLLGMESSRIFAGAMVTEVVFSWPGIGRLLTQSLVTRDYPVLMGCFTIMSLLVILGNIMADIACAIADPRIRLE